VENVITKLALLFLLIVPSLPAQPSISKPAHNRCDFSEVYRAEGWKIPGLSGAKAKTRPASLSNHPGVFLTDLNPGESETELMMPRCPLGSPGRLAIETRPIKVTEIWKIDFGGKVFAYEIAYTDQKIGKDGRINLLSGGRVIFFDTDGSGSFAVMKYTAHIVGAEIEVPPWAK
jgi:hypothetical protein